MQRSDRTTVLTAFNQEEWDRFGITWLASLRDLAKYHGDVCIISDGLNEKVTRFLGTHNVRLVPVERKFKEPKLNHFCTAMQAAGDLSAYWDHSFYFQADLGELFEIASDTIVAATASSPLPTFRNSLEGFGFKDACSLAPSVMRSTLLNIARRNGTRLQGQFVAGRKDALNFLGRFVEFHSKWGYVSESPHAVDLSLNLFYSANLGSFTIDSRWSDLVDAQWTWLDGFYEDDSLVKVVSFPPGQVYSAVCARFHFVNAYRELHTAWLARYRDQFSMPRLLFTRMKKEPPNEKAPVQVRQGE